MILNAYATGKTEYLGLTPISAGHIFAKEGRAIERPQGRCDYLLFFVLKGEELFHLPGGDALMRPGGFILFAPGEAQMHRTVSRTRSEFYYMHFFAAPDFLARFGLVSSKVYQARPTPELSTIFERVIAEMQMKQAGYEAISACCLHELLLLLCRNMGDARAIRPHTDRIAFAVQAICREYAENRPLDAYAAMLSMSKYHFSRLFTGLTGISPMAYRNHLRLEHAKEMLLDGGKTVAEIAAAVGYDSPAYFCHFFRKHIGMTPSEYRESLLKSE